MAGMFGGSSSSTTAVVYTGIQVQTSSEGICIPIVWGKARVAPNLLWADNFKQPKAGKKGSSGGKGGKSSNKKNDYYAAVLMGLCEGPIQTISQVFYNSTVVSLASLGLTLYTGTRLQAAWPAISTGAYTSINYPLTAFVASNNYDLGTSATLPSHGMEVVGFGSGSIAGSVDVDPAYVIADFLCNVQYGMGMSPDNVGDLTQLSAACRAQGILFSYAMVQQEQAISVLQRWAQITNSWIFWSGDQMKFIPLLDTPMSGNGADFVPNLTPLYALTYEDFTPGAKGDPPVVVLREDPAAAYNWIKVNSKDRATNYGTATVEYKDQTAIDLYGLSQPQSVKADEICDRSTALVIAAILGQRSVYVRNTYSFGLGYNFVLLEPGDIVTLTEPGIGIALLPVRITTVDENDKGGLSVTAEECPLGIGTPTIQTTQAWAGLSRPALYVEPGPVNPPAIIEPPAAMTGGAAQVWVGLSGGDTWGGAECFLSLDDVTYLLMGSISAPTPQGTLRSALPAHADPDTASTLQVDLTESLGLLSSAVTPADADAGRVVALVDAELVGYGAVVPNGAGAHDYDLTYLRRGSYGTTAGPHAAGAPFSALVPAHMLQINLPQAYVGQTLYLKFPSFNLYGQALEDISTVARYTYVPLGRAYAIDAPTMPVLTVNTPAGSPSIAMQLTWTPSDGPNVGSNEVQFSADAGATWTALDATAGPSATRITLNPAQPLTAYAARVRASSANGLAVSAWATAATVGSGPAPAAAGSASNAQELTLVTGDIPIGIVVDPSGVPIYVSTAP